MTTPRPGQPKYLVVWKEGFPHVAHGKVIESGKKRILKCSFMHLEGPIPTREGHDSVQDALDAAVLDIARHYGGGFFPAEKQRADPRLLVRYVSRLQRLYRKCQKHGLV
jgi:hypothetical protein